MDKKRKIEVQLSTPQRLYVKVYHDFLDSKLLTGDEKIVFIALKRYIDFKSDQGEAFPTIEKLCNITGYGNQKINKILKSLKNKGVVKIIRRGLSKPNLYTITDNADMWKAETLEELEIASNESEIDRSIRILTAAGYDVTKKEPDCNPPKETQSSPRILNQENNTIEKVSCQDAKSSKTKKEKYTTEMINDIFEYNAMINDYPSLQKEIDIVMNILYDTLNTSKETIRVSGENKPSQVVISRLMQLDTESIMYAIRKFNDQTNKLKDPSAYMLTLLYKAKDQEHLDIVNQFNHDMSKI